jgi:hypothetical protein
MSTDVSTQTDDELVEASKAIKLAAPVIALTAAWAVRKVLDKGYTSVTGENPPKATDPDAPMRRILVYAISTAAAVALVNVLVDRLTATRRTTRSAPPLA